MGTNNHINLLDSNSEKEQSVKEIPCCAVKPSQARKLLADGAQSHLRLVVVNEDPRKCAQSTSERSSSQVTLDPDSRSIAIAKDSPQGRSPYATLRKWPAVVPHCLANDSRSDSDMVFRKSRSCMPEYHHTVIDYATPSGDFTKWCTPLDNGSMANEDADVRRANLQRLIDRDYGSNKSSLARAVKRAQSYISDLLRPAGKSFAEKAARNIEIEVGLLKGQLSIPHSPLLYDESRRNRVREELRDAIEDLDRDEQQEVLAAIRKVQGRRTEQRRKAG
jgi:hypothetical protein